MKKINKKDLGGIQTILEVPAQLSPTHLQHYSHSQVEKTEAANASLFVIVRQPDHGQIANVSEQNRS